jgi:hypothetical protein
MNTVTHLARKSTALMFLAVLTLASCIPNQVEKSKGETLDQYETIIRWSQWDAAADFIAPEYMAEHPISRLEMDRLRLFRVTSYTLRSAASLDEGMTITQTVEIKMFNTQQAVERTVIQEQEWRFHESCKCWLLHSGMPDPTNRY